MPRPYIYFKSNGALAYRPLSNFLAAPVVLELEKVPVYASLLSPHIDRQRLPTPLRFPSSEHAWQALKADDVATFVMFLADGKFATLNASVFVWLTTKREWGKKSAEDYAHGKVRYYTSGGLNMVGVVPKLAASAERAKRLGYALRTDREYLPVDVEAALWHELLMAKMTQNEKPRQVLLDTGDSMIVEFENGARVRHSHWGGLVNEADGSVTGANRMGIYLERARTALRASHAAAQVEPEEERRGTKRARDDSDDDGDVAEPVAKKYSPCH